MYELLEIKPRVSPSLIFVLIITMGSIVGGNLILGVILVVLAIGVLFSASGFVIDKENNRMKNITYFLGVKFGKWVELPEISYISLLRVRQKRKGFSVSERMYTQRSTNNAVYQVNLIVIQNKRQRPMRLISTTLNQAIDEGLRLGEFLDKRVYDSTSNNTKWLR